MAQPNIRLIVNRREPTVKMIARLLQANGAFIDAVRDENRLDVTLFREMADAYDAIMECKTTKDSE